MSNRALMESLTNSAEGSPRLRPRVIVAVTTPRTAYALLRGQLRWFRDRGYEMILVASPGRELEASAEREGVSARPLPMVREISPTADLRSLGTFIGLLRSKRPDLTHVSTPKAGFLGGLAAWLTRVPCRIYTMRGLRLETVGGPQRALLWITEWLACATAHVVIVVSPSLAERAVQLRLLPRKKVVVIGRGSSNGVQADRFVPTDERRRAGQALRASLGISASDRVVGFVGRLSPDKGLVELIDAFCLLRQTAPAARLLIVGEFENQQTIDRRLSESVRAELGIHLKPWTDDPAETYHAMDIVVLPTHREGFPNVPLEAAAAGLPVVTTRATGAVDSIRDGKTGILVDAGNVRALAAALATLVEDPSAARAMGAAGMRWVSHDFKPETIWQGIESVYADLLMRGVNKRQPKE